MNLAAIETPESIEAAFESLKSAVEAIESHAMPPNDQAQPSEQERQQIKTWFNDRYVHIAPRAAPLRPRRLSAHEYRQTVRSLIGFDLEVTVTEAEETVSEKSMAMKLLPTDPPGASGFRNDTQRNPISGIAWGRYSELADLAIEDLFSDRRRTQLAALAGPLDDTAGFTSAHAERLVRYWFSRVYRRPLSPSEIDRIVREVTSADNPKAAAQFEIKTSLMSPRFLYRGLLAGAQARDPQATNLQSTKPSDPPKDPSSQHPVDSYELAERLSYFLWADMPDDLLLEAAANNSLQDENGLKQQTDRILADKRASNLATDLATQWLSLDEINEVSDDVPS